MIRIERRALRTVSSIMKAVRIHPRFRLLQAASLSRNYSSAQVAVAVTVGPFGPRDWFPSLWDLLIRLTCIRSAYSPAPSRGAGPLHAAPPFAASIDLLLVLA